MSQGSPALHDSSGHASSHDHAPGHASSNDHAPGRASSHVSSYDHTPGHASSNNHAPDHTPGPTPSIPSINNSTTDMYTPEPMADQGVRTFNMAYSCDDLDFLGGFSRDDRWRESMRDTGIVDHGFSFGEKDTSFDQGVVNKAYSKDSIEITDGEDDQEDEGISEVYQTEGIDDAIYAPSPLVSRRHVISQRIEHVGFMGQNLGMGHRIGILADDDELRPRVITPETLSIDLDEDSDTQTEVRWKPPQNCSKFQNLIYDIEASHNPAEDTWINANSIRLPEFRIYHTDDKLFVGKLRLLRQESDVVVRLRVRARGEISEDGNRHEVIGDWSELIVVTFKGTMGERSLREDVQTTNL